MAELRIKAFRLLPDDGEREVVIQNLTDAQALKAAPLARYFIDRDEDVVIVVVPISAEA